MPLAFAMAHPVGMNENSPTFQRWVREFRRAPSPEGTAENLRAPAAVPSGLIGPRTLVPNVETLGYYRMSLQDKALPRPGAYFVGSNLAALDRNVRAPSAAMAPG